MRRTTLAIEDGLLRELKHRAAAQGRTLQDVANEALRLGLAGRARRGEPYRLEIEGWEAELQPGVDLLDRDSLFEKMDEE